MNINLRIHLEVLWIFKRKARLYGSLNTNEFLDGFSFLPFQVFSKKRVFGTTIIDGKTIEACKALLAGNTVEEVHQNTGLHEVSIYKLRKAISNHRGVRFQVGRRSIMIQKSNGIDRGDKVVKSSGVDRGPKYVKSTGRLWGRKTIPESVKEA